jgi:hypothetical protein
MISLFPHLFLSSPFLRQKARLVKHRKTENERQLADGRGKEGVGQETNHTTTRKPGLSINHSVLSVYGSETFVITGERGGGHGGRQTGTLDLPLYALFLDEYKSPP